jgi:hypothetical protein
VVLPASEGEFGLNEEVIAGHKAAGDRRCNGPAHRRFIIMPALVRGVDTTKALLQRQLGQSLRIAFLPSRSVKEPGITITVNQQRKVQHWFSLIHPDTCQEPETAL